MTRLLSFVLIFSFTLASGKDLPNFNSHSINETNISELAVLLEDMSQYRVISNEQELYKHLYFDLNSPIYHLARISQSAKKHFLDSLVFSEFGLASLSTRDLFLLPEYEQAQILRLFGPDIVSSIVSEDYLTDDEIEFKKQLAHNIISSGGYMAQDRYCQIFTSISGCYRWEGSVCNTLQCPGGGGGEPGPPDEPE